MTFTESLAIALFEAVKREKEPGGPRWVDLDPEERAKTYRCVHAMLAEARVAITPAMAGAMGAALDDANYPPATEAWRDALDVALRERP